MAGLVLRGPLMAALTSRVDDPALREAERELGEFFLLAFLPQIWLYGIGMVLTGVLHAHHRFAGPAIAPLASSIVVTLSYLIYAMVEGAGAQDIFRISHSGRAILGVGTTVGVAVLSLSLVVPARRLGLRWRPALKVPREAAYMMRRLVGSALVAVAAQQVLLAVVLVFANGVEGGVVAYQLAFTILLLPWAVLVVPLATSSFPSLAAAAAQGREDEFAGRCAESMRNVVLVVFGGAAILFAAAWPLSRSLFSLGVGGKTSSHLVAISVAAFAPGLVGYGAWAFLTRVAYARGDGRSPALSSLAGFGGALALDLIASALFTGRVLIGALAVSFSIGIAGGAVFLLVRLRRSSGAAAFEGVAVASLRGVAAAAAGGGVGAWIGSMTSGGTSTEELASTAAAAVVAGIVFVVAQRILGDREMARVLAALRRRPMTQERGTRGKL